MKISNKKSSSNYGWFKLLSNNREVSKLHLVSLRKEFEKYGNITQISPITVNKNGFILDGQHRAQICEENNLPIYYIEVDAKKEITPAMNWKQKSWSAMDYINFYAAYKPEYSKLREFMTMNDITYPIASALLFSNLNRKFAADKRLKDGTLEVSDLLERGQRQFDIISEISGKMGASMNDRYVRGLIRCLDNEDFDLSRFHTKLDLVMRMSPNLPNPRLGAMEDVMRNIESIYNFMTGSKTRTILFR